MYTDGQGQYKIVDLRPGVYAVTMSLPGFSTLRPEGLELTVGFTATVNAGMEVGGLITVTGASPVVDVQNVTQTRVLTRNTVNEIPSGRNFTMLANLVPGMVVGGGGVSVGQDVGGQSGGTSQRLMLHGGTVSDLERSARR